MLVTPSLQLMTHVLLDVGSSNDLQENVDWKLSLDEALVTKGNESETHGFQLLVVDTTIVLLVLVNPGDQFVVWVPVQVTRFTASA
ncbi:hypothetical protein D5S10_05400 [Pseudomonas savastanoi]|uniref:Uncharacterized protein n=2 Tax=Pseudomonas amygdali TaxID=47877 RepID=A0AAX1VYS6_PSEAJ|nr:hypothetical protein ALO35_101747 [Pseudomonas amygdali pv. lachrymans]KPY78739.1 Uncharacterized protein ALO60_04963 [Pseudomonas amygdali pv. tabaci]QED83105.1 hypothetical protein PSYTB_05010 [Pseudomonas amygdali pv. tabaci str. ATCC 11528]QOI03366.1 hypothetical protein D5S10_05400 [Pseudomonas savastanoi]RML83312.1 hypothetical protein ALQ89_02068 [Pseudomonas amygdali pv. tabaci]